MTTNMPSETITGAVGTIVAAVVGIITAYGIEVPAAVVSSVIVLLSWLAFGITLWVRRTRARVVADVPQGTAPED